MMPADEKAQSGRRRYRHHRGEPGKCARRPIRLGQLLVLVAVAGPRSCKGPGDENGHSHRAVPQEHREEHSERENPARRQHVIHGVRKLGILPARRLVPEGAWAGSRTPGRTEGWQASVRLV
jgi:hypothetical protein